MYRVKLNSSLTAKDIIICIIVTILLYIFCRKCGLDINPLFYIAVLVGGGLLEFINGGELVVSDLIINDRNIELIYRKNGKIEDRVVIEKSNILSFDIQAHITEQSRRITETKCNFKINLKNGEEIYFIVKSSASDIKPSSWFASTFQPLINIAIAQNKYKLPNFSCEIVGSKYVKDAIEHYLRHGKCSFLQNTFIQFNSSKQEKFIIIFAYSVIAFIVITLIGLAIFFSIAG